MLQRAFGMNQHLLAPRITEIVSEITGWKIGRTIEHGSGKIDSVVASTPAHVTPEQIEDRMPLNDFRRMIYDYHRHRGMSHDDAVGTLFRDGKVEA